MNNNEKIDVYRTLMGIADFFAGNKGVEKTAFIVAASDGSDDFSVTVSGEKEKVSKLCCNMLSDIIDELAKTFTEDEISQLTADITKILIPGAYGAEDWYYDENTTHSDDDEEEIFYDEICSYDDCCWCYYDDDTQEGEKEEAVKELQLSISESMQVFEGFLAEGTVTDTDGKEYEIVFHCKSPDSSCIYLEFTDNEVIDNQLILLTAKTFPVISETTLFPITEWESVALRMEKSKQIMYGDAV